MNRGYSIREEVPHGPGHSVDNMAEVLHLVMDLDRKVLPGPFTALRAAPGGRGGGGVSQSKEA